MDFHGQILAPFSSPEEALKRGFPKEDCIYLTSQPWSFLGKEEKKRYTTQKFYLDATNRPGCCIWLSPALLQQPPQPQRGDRRAKAPGQRLQSAQPQQATGANSAPPGPGGSHSCLPPTPEAVRTGGSVRLRPALPTQTVKEKGEEPESPKARHAATSASSMEEKKNKKKEKNKT